MITAINRALDGLVRPELPVLGRMRSAFQVLGFTGLGAAAIAALVASALRGLRLLDAVLMLLVGAATFLALAAFGKWRRGQVQLVFYRHAIAIGLATAALATARDRPLGAYLDVAAIAVAAFLVFGRTACLMVGCCHGAPAGLGVRYGAAHARAGFPSALVGVRTFPTQAFEAAAALALVAGGLATLALTEPAPGQIALGITAGYACTRFLLETRRGDAARAMVGGFSEAQWLSLAAVGAIALVGATGSALARSWQLGPALGLGAIAGFIVVWRYLGSTPRHRLLGPAHVHEVATALATLARGPRTDAITIATTSLGVRLSRARVDTGPTEVETVSISHRDGPLPEGTARVVVDLVRDLRPHRQFQIIASPRGVVHLLLIP